MTRERLPSRRRAVTKSLSWNGARIHVSAGFSPDGRILETFLRGGGRIGSHRDHELDDIAVVLSRLLQHGDVLTGIARGVGRLPGAAAASIVGAVVDKLVEIEASI